MDCRGDELIQHNNRTSAQAVPFQYLINEQAKSILALQELQNEVGALLEFRDMVMDTFPHLRQKQLSSPEPSSGSQCVGSGESRWEPGVRVRRKLGSSSAGWIAGGGLSTVAGPAGTSTVPRSRSNSHGGASSKGPKSGEPTTTSVGTVQDSGFCAESSKDSSSSGSRGKKDDDELWSLLEAIQDKGSKLKLEARLLQTRLLDDERQQRRRKDGKCARRLSRRRCRSLEDLSPCRMADGCQVDGPHVVAEYTVFRTRVEELKRERDALMDRVVEMEAESQSSVAQIHRLLAELRSVVSENRELEERLCGGDIKSTLTATSKSSHNNCGAGGFAPVQPESTSSGGTPGGRDAYYTPSQHSACNLSSIELCKQCSSYETDDGGRSRQRLMADMVRPSDPICRNLEGRAPSPLSPGSRTALDIGSPTFAKRLGALDGIVSSPADRMAGKPVPGCGSSTPMPRRTLAAILKTFNPIELQRHLITVSYENTNLVRQVELLNKSKINVSNELNRSKEDNEELKFQLEEKRIELEGTMARVRLLQMHQEQHQHGPTAAAQSPTTVTTAITSATNQWLDLVPSNPILPQIALPATPTSTNGHRLHHHNHHNHHNQDENVGGGSSSTESAHQARSASGGQRQPSKIPVVKSSYSVPRPPSSYRGEHHHAARDPYPSWNKCKSDQSLPRNWDPIKSNGNGGGSSIGSGGGRTSRGPGKQQQQQHHHQQDSLQDNKHYRARKDSGGGATSLTRAKSQNHHQRTTVATAKDGRTAAIGASQAADDTNKPKKQLVMRRRNLVRQKSRLLMDPKTALPAVDEVQEPTDDSAAVVAAAIATTDGRLGICLPDNNSLDDENDDELFFDSIESSLATSASSRRPPPECDSIDLSQPDYSVASSLAT